MESGKDDRLAAHNRCCELMNIIAKFECLAPDGLPVAQFPLKCQAYFFASTHSGVSRIIELKPVSLPRKEN